MADAVKAIVWLHGEIKSPPFSLTARRTAGFLLRCVQRGMALSMPHSRPMPSVGPRCHELRIRDVERKVAWRMIYRIDDDAIVLVDVFEKKTRSTPKSVIDTCRRRLWLYDAAGRDR